MQQRHRKGTAEGGQFKADPCAENPGGAPEMSLSGGGIEGAGIVEEMIAEADREASTMTDKTFCWTHAKPEHSLPPDSAEEALAAIVANQTGHDVSVRIAQVDVSDDRGAVQGWHVVVKGPDTATSYEVIPPEGGSLDCWLPPGLAACLDSDAVQLLVGWLQ